MNKNRMSRFEIQQDTEERAEELLERLRDVLKECSSVNEALEKEGNYYADGFLDDVSLILERYTEEVINVSREYRRFACN